MSDIMVNGHVVLDEIEGSAGDDNGIASVVVPVQVDTIAQAMSLSAAAVAAAISLSNVRCVDRPFKQNAFGFRVDFRFEGLNAEYENTPPEAYTYQFSGEDGERPIQLHPNFEAFKKKYGWDKDQKKFPDIMPNAGGALNSMGRAMSAAAATILGASQETPSPFAGVEGFYSAGGQFTVTFATRTPPAYVHENVGEIIGYPPGAEKLSIPRYAGRNWLKLTPEITPRGSAYVITLRYKLSGPEGINPEVYNFAPMRGGRKPGLTSGSIQGAQGGLG